MSMHLGGSNNEHPFPLTVLARVNDIKNVYISNFSGNGRIDVGIGVSIRYDPNHFMILKLSSLSKPQLDLT